MASTTAGPATRRPVALVTGASAGLGCEFAHQLAARGHDLVLVARDERRLRAVAGELASAYGVESEVLPADLSDRARTQVVCDRLADPDRPVDVLVNNAGFGLRRRFLDDDVTPEEEALDVMVRAVLLTSHAAGRAMRERGHGVIVNVSSVASFLATGSYSAEKSFVTVLSESLAGELRPHGVTVTALCPGFIRTEFHERADLAADRLPSWAFLTAPDVVRACLADVARGRVVSVPSRRYRLAVAALRLLPRSVARSDLVRGRHRRRVHGS